MSNNTTKKQKSFAEELKELHISLIKDNMRAEQMKRRVLIPISEFPISESKDAESNDDDTYAWDFLSSKDPEFSVVYTKARYGEIREVSNKKIEKDIDIYKEDIQESINAFFKNENFDIVKRMQDESFQKFMNWVCDTDDAKVKCNISFEPFKMLSNEQMNMDSFYEKYDDYPCYALKNLKNIVDSPIDSILYELFHEDNEPFKDFYTWRETKEITNEIIGWAYEIVVNYFNHVRRNYYQLHDIVNEKTVYRFPKSDIYYQISIELFTEYF